MRSIAITFLTLILSLFVLKSSWAGPCQSCSFITVYYSPPVAHESFMLNSAQTSLEIRGGGGPCVYLCKCVLNQGTQLWFCQASALDGDQGLPPEYEDDGFCQWVSGGLGMPKVCENAACDAQTGPAKDTD